MGLGLLQHHAGTEKQQAFEQGMVETMIEGGNQPQGGQGRVAGTGEDQG